MHVQNVNPECTQPLSYAQQLAYNAVKWEHAHSSHYTKWKYDVPQGYTACTGQKPFCTEGDYGVPKVVSWGSTCSKARTCPPCPKTAPSNPDVSKTPAEQMLYFQRNFDSKCNDLNKLSHDLSNMMEQLACLTKNKNTALKIVNELQQNYKNLLKKSNQQEKEIEALRCENKKLLLLRKENTEGAELGPLKQGLQTCENKLQMLERSMKEMVKKYQNMTENGVVNQNENQELLKVNAQLTTRLKQALEDLDKYRNRVTGICKLYNDLDEGADPKHQKMATQQKSLGSRLQRFEENDMKKLQEIISQNDMQLENEVKKISSYIGQQPSADVSITKSSSEVVEMKKRGSHKETSKNKSSHLQMTVTSKGTIEKKEERPVGLKTSTPRTVNETISLKESNGSIELKKSISQLMGIIHEEIDKTIDKGKRMEEIEEMCDSQCLDFVVEEASCGSDCVLATDKSDDECCTSVQYEEAQIDQELMTEELKILETKYCTTIDEDYELECLCEPCDG